MTGDSSLPPENRTEIWLGRLRRRRSRLSDPPLPVVEGKLSRMVGLTLEAVGCRAAIGSTCLIESRNGKTIEAEVVGFSGERLFLMPIGELHGLEQDCRVIPTGAGSRARVGPGLLGRILDGTGAPLDGKGPVKADIAVHLNGAAVNPLLRRPIRDPLNVGVRAINALLTVGRGQRLGLFAGTGVGKSVLLGMMTKFTDAHVIVVGLIGERGREVNDFIQNILGSEGLARAVVVAAPADNPPLLRVHGAMLAASLAEYFRAQGLDVLLLMDSLTRFAHAHREISLAIGEPPATKGYPPSVFSKLSQLAERSGNGSDAQGSITAFYTVLAENDDHNDPIADAARGILDGHIVLSRALAEAGHYPAIDIEASVSRTMPEVAAPDHLQMAGRFKQLYALYRQNRDLINVGAYQPGTDPHIDLAVQMQPALMAFLRQDMDESVDIDGSLAQLARLLGEREGNPATQLPARRAIDGD